MRRIKYVLCLVVICLSLSSCFGENESVNTGAGVQQNAHEEYDKAGKVEVTINNNNKGMEMKIRIKKKIKTTMVIQKIAFHYKSTTVSKMNVKA